MSYDLALRRAAFEHNALRRVIVGKCVLRSADVNPQDVSCRALAGKDFDLMVWILEKDSRADECKHDVPDILAVMVCPLNHARQIVLKGCYTVNLERDSSILSHCVSYSRLGVSLRFRFTKRDLLVGSARRNHPLRLRHMGTITTRQNK